MKYLKISVLALSLGIFIASCDNKANCTKSDSDSSSVAQGAGVPATDASGGAYVNSPEPTDKKEQSTRVEVIHVRKSDTLANNNPDVKAANKRSGNFTNGTGQDNPGR
jgi:hypothetical protein